MLSKAELRTLGTLTHETTVGELSEDLGHSLSYTSEIVSRLKNKGLINTKKDGREKLISPSESKAIQLLRELTQRYNHIGWSELIAGKAFEVLYYLGEPRTVSELAEETDNYRATVHRIVERLLDRGIITKSNSKYELNEEFHILNDFVREYYHQQHRQKITDCMHTKSTTSGTEGLGYAIIWENHAEFLVSTHQEITDENFHLTGPERFQEYSIELIPKNKKYHFYSETMDALKPEDIVCHTLLIDDDIRYRIYCMLLIEREKIHDEVVEASEKYGLTDVIKPLIDYLQKEGENKAENLPEWDEFVSEAHKYEVNV